MLAPVAGRYPARHDLNPIDLDTLRHGARLAGFAWSDSELEAIRPHVEAALRLLRALEALPVDAEPPTHYRTV